VQYPRVSPAIIVLIHRPGQILLTRQPSWPPNRYSLVAGFVEAGESLEECLRREVAEEVGAAVDDIRYLGSQPWPFPHQLMVGFLARYRSGELRIDEQELEHAAWFDLDALPDLPPPLSISRRILDWHLAAQRDPLLPFPPFDILAP
jgi:NAD+ diphosphatase